MKNDSKLSPFDAIGNLHRLVHRYNQVDWYGAAEAVSLALMDSAALARLALMGQVAKAMTHEMSSEEKSSVDAMVTMLESTHAVGEDAGTQRVVEEIAALDSRLNRSAS